MRFVLIFALLLINFSVESQEVTRALQVVNNLPYEITQFIPDGHVALDTNYGDINQDGIMDMILITCHPNEIVFDTIEYYRPLILLLGQKNSGYKLAARNDKVVGCVTCGGMTGDPFTGVSTHFGEFTVEHFGGSNWRWSHDITFRYSPEKQNWFLYEIVDMSYHVANLDNATKKVKTVKDFGIVLFEEYDLVN